MIDAPEDNVSDLKLGAQQALQAEFSSLIDRAIAAGSSKMQAVTAISDLATDLAHVTSPSDNNTSDRKISGLPNVSPFA